MNKTLLILLAAILLFGCKSKEDKAQELIKENMFKTLYDYSSYEPIELKMDSSFTSIYKDSIVFQNGHLLQSCLKELKNISEEMKDVRNTLEIWGDGYSGTSRRKIKEALEKRDEIIEKRNAVNEIIKPAQKKIREINKNFKSEFDGWKAYHKFRCKNKGGNFSIGNYVYYFDKNISKILSYHDVEDEDYIQVINLINESLNESDDE